jgi:hypothetical protein
LRSTEAQKTPYSDSPEYGTQSRKPTKIIAYCPTAVPPSKESVDELVKDLDANKSGSIDGEEFEVLATVCVANFDRV